LEKELQKGKQQGATDYLDREWVEEIRCKRKVEKGTMRNSKGRRERGGNESTTRTIAGGECWNRSTGAGT